jgi:hypothetical protein
MQGWTPLKRLLPFAFVLLSACQLALPGDGGTNAGRNADAPNAVTGDEITVTTLDAPTGGPVTGLAQEQAAANPEVPNPDPAAETEAEVPPAEPTAGDAGAPAEDAPPQEIDPALLTPEALACAKDGGRWSRFGASEARACLTPTGDAGKRCTKDSDCEGVCLARSGSCAPVSPLFGCNEVLQDDGRRMTLCLD